MVLNYIHPIYVLGKLREKIYSSGLLKKIKLKAPVISVGNLQFGGSGKTPFVMFLLSHFSGRKIAVISQSYKANLSHPEKVDLAISNFFKRYGDEPSLIKKNFPQVDVWCGPVKWETAQCADQHDNYDLIILDDGFTHHKLSRDLDIVLVDGSRKFSTFQLPPHGRLREPIEALKRSDLVLLTKIKSLNENANLFEAIGDIGVELGLINYEIDDSEVKIDARYLLFAGIGNFDYFKKNAIEKKVPVAEFQQFANHSDYSEDKQLQILSELKKSGLRGLTTTKDKIKLTNAELIRLTDCLQIKIKMNEPTQKLLETELGKIFPAKNF
jgi:tetraacyldisaccharide 4'-kinase